MSWDPRGHNCAAAAVLKEARVLTPSSLNREVLIYYRLPAKFIDRRLAKILVLIPSINSSGRVWLEGDNEWTRFADREGLLLVGPSFQTTMEEIKAHRGYYYPALWSGKAMLEAVEEIGRRELVPTDRFLLFGFSAGAHFTHGFARWKPERVRAFVAYSAAWWDKPTPAARTVPGLIMCGEADERLEASRTFLQDALQARLPWMWRSYAGVGHEVRPQVLRMAQSFLGYYANAKPAQGKEAVGFPRPAYYGDIQQYEFFAAESEEAKRIPNELRIPIPSREVAEIWKEEKPRCCRGNDRLVEKKRVFPVKINRPISVSRRPQNSRSFSTVRREKDGNRCKAVQTDIARKASIHQHLQ